MTTVQWRSESDYADSNGVVSSREWLTGTGTGGATVLDLGAYCAATPSGSVSNTSWSSTAPEYGAGTTYWPAEAGALLLPFAGEYLVTTDFPDNTGDQSKYFLWRAWPGVLAQVRWWRIIA